MNRKEQRVLDQFKPGEWLKYQDVRMRYIDSAVVENDWGAVSFLISFFSRKQARGWFDFFTGADITVALHSLHEEGYLDREWFPRPEADIQKEVDQYGIDLESMDKTSIDYRLLTRRARFRITEDGLRARMRKLGEEPHGSLASAT